MGELNCAIQSDCIGISSGAASVRPDEYARQTLGMSLHKDPSLFARCLVADRATRGPSCSPTIESFLWTSCLEPDVSYFQFDSLSPDDQKLAMQNQSIQAAHHKKKPEENPAGQSGSNKAVPQGKVFKSFSKRKAAAPPEEMTSLEGPIRHEDLEVKGRSGCFRCSQ